MLNLVWDWPSSRFGIGIPIDRDRDFRDTATSLLNTALAGRTICRKGPKRTEKDRKGPKRNRKGPKRTNNSAGNDLKYMARQPQVALLVPADKSDQSIAIKASR